MAFREGVLVYSQPGALPAAALDQLIDAVRELDMAEVHAKVGPGGRRAGRAGLTRRRAARLASDHGRTSVGRAVRRDRAGVVRVGPTSSSPTSSPASPPGRALDLAAGEGRNALWLAERGWQVTAVDFSPGRPRQGPRARRAARRSTWTGCCADALTYDAGPDAFDLVVLAYLQLVADERRTAVRAAFASLRPGGTFFLVAHDSTNLTEGTGGPTGPAVLFTAEEVLADLDGERFEVAAAPSACPAAGAARTDRRTRGGDRRATGVRRPGPPVRAAT